MWIRQYFLDANKNLETEIRLIFNKLGKISHSVKSIPLRFTRIRFIFFLISIVILLVNAKHKFRDLGYRFIWIG
jgi:hypothetical protein